MILDQYILTKEDSFASSKLLRHYIIRGRIAHALFGDVLLCKHLPSKKMVAIKRIFTEFAAAQVTFKTRRKVAESVAVELSVYRTLMNRQSQSNYIVKLLDKIEHEGCIYLVLEYCEGGELLSVLQSKEENRLSIAETSRYFRQIVSGVTFMHRNGYAHRDLSLENVLLTKDRICKLCDFGLAFPVHATCSDTVGKAFYMAPEVRQGKVYDPAKADVWSLGAMLFIMLTGSPPFESAQPSDKRFQVVAKHGVKALLSSWEVALDMPQSAVDLIHRMLCVNPKRRISLNEVSRHPFLIAEKKKDHADKITRDKFLSMPMRLSGRDNFLAISMHYLFQRKSKNVRAAPMVV